VFATKKHYKDIHRKLLNKYDVKYFMKIDGMIIYGLTKINLKGVKDKKLRSLQMKIKG